LSKFGSPMTPVPFHWVCREACGQRLYSLGAYSAELLQQRFTAPKLYNLWPQASLHTQWNGTGVRECAMRMTGDPMVSSRVAPAAWTVDCWWVAELRNSLVHSIVSIEPTGPPFQDAVFSNSSTRAYGLTDIPGDPMVSSRVAPAAWTVDCWWVAELRNSTVEE
jgi:hypothetical protein